MANGFVCCSFNLNLRYIISKSDILFTLGVNDNEHDTERDTEHDIEYDTKHDIKHTSYLILNHHSEFNQVYQTQTRSVWIASVFVHFGLGMEKEESLWGRMNSRPLASATHLGGYPFVKYYSNGNDKERENAAGQIWFNCAHGRITYRRWIVSH